VSERQRANHVKSSRLLLASHNFPPARGGIQRMADRLATNILPGSTTVLAAPDDDAAAFDEFSSYEVVRRPLVGKKPPRWRRAEHSMSTLLACKEAVIAMEWWPEGRAIASLRARPTSAVVVYGTDVAGALPVSRVRRSMTTALHGADVVIAISAFAANLASTVGVEPVVIHPGVDLDPVGSAPTDLALRLHVKDRPVVLTVARLVERKGHADFLALWPKVVAAVPDAVWLVVGEGPEEQHLRALAPESVHFLGAVDDHTLSGLYALADLHVLPGRRVGTEIEGFGMAAVEAGGASTPTVATDVGGTAEAVGAGGLLVPPGQPDQLAESVIQLLRDDSARRALGARARQRAESLAWPEVGRRYREAIGLTATASVVGCS
jgi:phosphatidyl-myo-inositol dimannoside synthase